MFGFRPYRRGPAPVKGRQAIRRAAIRHAQKEVPHGEEPSAWVQSSFHACCSWSEDLAGSWRRADQALLADWLALGDAVRNAENELRRARYEEERCEGARAPRAPLHHEQQNPMGDSLSTRAYIAATAVLTCLELPLVYMSFTAFGLPPAFTVLLSFLSAGIVAFLGHALGTVSRHLRISARTLLLLLVGLSAGFTGSLAWLREGALEVIGSDTATLDPAAAAWALFAISLASLAVASLLAWHHGVDPQDRDLFRARHIRRSWERRLERLSRRLRQVETRRTAVWDRARQDVETVGAQMLRTFSEYAQWNQLYRDKHDLPACLRGENLPRLPMPALLRQPLAWTALEPAPEGGVRTDAQLDPV